jgi:hypothetical protein
MIRMQRKDGMYCREIGMSLEHSHKQILLSLFDQYTLHCFDTLDEKARKNQVKELYLHVVR